jgi:hypothetical protein
VALTFQRWSGACIVAIETSIRVQRSFPRLPQTSIGEPPDPACG